MKFKGYLFKIMGFSLLLNFSLGKINALQIVNGWEKTGMEFMPSPQPPRENPFQLQESTLEEPLIQTPGEFKLFYQNYFLGMATSSELRNFSTVYDTSQILELEPIFVRSSDDIPDYVKLVAKGKEVRQEVDDFYGIRREKYIVGEDEFIYTIARFEEEREDGSVGLYSLVSIEKEQFGERVNYSFGNMREFFELKCKEGEECGNKLGMRGLSYSQGGIKPAEASEIFTDVEKWTERRFKVEFLDRYFKKVFMITLEPAQLLEIYQIIDDSENLQREEDLRDWFEDKEFRVPFSGILNLIEQYDKFSSLALEKKAERLKINLNSEVKNVIEDTMRGIFQMYPEDRLYLVSEGFFVLNKILIDYDKENNEFSIELEHPSPEGIALAVGKGGILPDGYFIDGEDGKRAYFVFDNDSVTVVKDMEERIDWVRYRQSPEGIYIEDEEKSYLVSDIEADVNMVNFEIATDEEIEAEGIPVKKTIPVGVKFQVPVSYWTEEFRNEERTNAYFYKSRYSGGKEEAKFEEFLQADLTNFDKENPNFVKGTRKETGFDRVEISTTIEDHYNYEAYVGDEQSISFVLPFKNRIIQKINGISTVDYEITETPEDWKEHFLDEESGYWGLRRKAWAQSTYDQPGVATFTRTVYEEDRIVTTTTLIHYGKETPQLDHFLQGLDHLLGTTYFADYSAGKEVKVNVVGWLEEEYLKNGLYFTVAFGWGRFMPAGFRNLKTQYIWFVINYILPELQKFHVDYRFDSTTGVLILNPAEE